MKQLPSFWPADTELWIIQVEAQFVGRRITAEVTRYHRIMSNLPPATAKDAKHLPNFEGGTHSTPQTIRTLTVTAAPERQAPCVTGLDSTLVREVFLQRFPSKVHVALATVAEKDFGKMAAITDTVIAAATSCVSIANAQLREEIARLTDTVAYLQARTSCPLKQRTAPPQQQRLRWCWYHRKHGDAARKCVAPCEYPGNVRGQN
ncbi:hypothetical protein HPB49_008120 [Dermacentor silvarum]|uniref:Uncharacterized protein n=1 Tax=Dermacentor silvarum TaxID=543639 RepID=A0ACB8CJS4_DERSI|nr:hypothetical protein HPB49_008120 [Dermacentor silvarum]